MRIFDATNTTQFGFGPSQTMNAGAGLASFKQTMGAAAQTNTTGGFIKQGSNLQGAANAASGAGGVADPQSDMKMVQVNSDKLKKLNSDPVAAFLETVNQLEFIVSLPPTLNKDIRQIRVENFHRALFNKTSNGALIKNELLKLKNGTREPL